MHRGPANIPCIVPSLTDDPRRNPHAKTAGTKHAAAKKFKEALATRFWQPLPCKHLLPCIGWFDILPLRLGVGLGGGSSPCENLNPRGPLSHVVWVSIATWFFFPLFFLFHIFVVVFVFAPASTSIRSLSLSHFYLSMSFYISLVSLCVSPRVSLQKSKDLCKADSTLRTSRAVPHPGTNLALCRLTSEVDRDPVHSTRYGRQRAY